jgi:hypothetical protein
MLGGFDLLLQASIWRSSIDWKIGKKGRLDDLSGYNSLPESALDAQPAQAV